MAIKKYDGFLLAEDYYAAYSKVPRLCVDIFVYRTKENGGGVILTKRNIEPYKGLWHLPGGGVKKGESIHAAIGRIARAELGIEVNIGGIAGVIEYKKEQIEHWETARHSISIVYFVQPKRNAVFNHRKYGSKIFYDDKKKFIHAEKHFRDYNIVFPPDNQVNPDILQFLKSTI